MSLIVVVYSWSAVCFVVLQMWQWAAWPRELWKYRIASCNVMSGHARLIQLIQLKLTCRQGTLHFHWGCCSKRTTFRLRCLLKLPRLSNTRPQDYMTVGLDCACCQWHEEFMHCHDISWQFDWHEHDNAWTVHVTTCDLWFSIVVELLQSEFGKSEMPAAAKAGSPLIKREPAVTQCHKMSRFCHAPAFFNSSSLYSRTSCLHV